MGNANQKKTSAGGRPPKFKEPRRPITVTLPERTLEKLNAIDEDRARAIVKAVDGMSQLEMEDPEIVEVAPGISILIVPPSKMLKEVPWIRMIEVSPMRFLLTILPGTTIEKIEVGLSDLIEDAKIAAPAEIPFLEKLKLHFTQLRRGDSITKAEILVFSGLEGRSGPQERSSVTSKLKTAGKLVFGGLCLHSALLGDLGETIANEAMKFI